MFITNDKNNISLSETLLKSIPYCQEIKILVGFFYFSGFYGLLDEIIKNQNLKIKVLVGMDADVWNEKILEIHSFEDNLTNSAIKQNFIQNLSKVFRLGEFDNQEFYFSVDQYITLLEQGRLEIRKTKIPNHSKLYIFQMNEDTSNLLPGFFITGSSNLTRSGLQEQQEFNVSIKDYGFKETNQYFDELWESSIPFKKDDIQKIIFILQNETLKKTLTPFEAYLYVLKTYLDSFKKKEISTLVKEKMEQIGYQPFGYQLDAISQALAILEEYHGVIIADVVGLGKSVIASAIAFELKKRGLVIAPPGLIGNEDKTSGWKKYIEDFGLASIGWEAYSAGNLKKVFEITQNVKDFEVVIVDEAHRFRNQGTQSYDLLKEICRNKKVILLTATPFNNQPADIFSLLKLFIHPKNSSITLNPDLEAEFNHYGYQFKQLLFIKKNYLSKNEEKAQKAQKNYQAIFSSSEAIQIQKVENALKELSFKIKNVLTPVMIRRNRLDLVKNPNYKNDIHNLSTVKDPIHGFYYLTAKQSQFYDRVIQTYFIEEGEFTGAIYMPFLYSKKTIHDFDELFQTNLYNLMRRLLVKRFESSFGAFYQTIQNFIRIHQQVLEFIQKTKHYILDRQWIDKISELEEEEFLEEFQQKMLEIQSWEDNKKSKILYPIEELSENFIDDIQKDIQLLENIQLEIEQLELNVHDPKANYIAETLSKQLNKEPNRKLIIFTEFQATVQHLKNYFQEHFSELFKHCLFITGNISKTNYQVILENFDASLPIEKQKNQYQILICTDKLSEGFNLNRAGFIINYDIPWNPVRVIQRLGRINRIGKKMFEELYIMNLFPTEKGEDVIKQKAIAESKMFMIHNSIGEDAKIFSSNENPTPSELYNRLNTNPENLEDESTYTKVFQEFTDYQKLYPELLAKLNDIPPRIKTSKLYSSNELITIIQKSHLYFVHTDYNSNETRLFTFEEIWNKIRCNPEDKKLKLSSEFWKHYPNAIQYQPEFKNPIAESSIYTKAFNKIQMLKQNFAENFPEILDFLQLLEKDLQNLGTLSDYRLKQLLEIKNEKDIFEFQKDLSNEYIDSLRDDTAPKKKIIIAIENQSPNLLNSPHGI